MSLSIFALKNCRYAVSQKVFFNLVKKLFKWNVDKSRKVLFLVGSEIEGIFDLGWLRKKVFMSLSNFVLKNFGMQFYKIVSLI